LKGAFFTNRESTSRVKKAIFLLIPVVFLFCVAEVSTRLLVSQPSVFNWVFPELADTFVLPDKPFFRQKGMVEDPYSGYRLAQAQTQRPPRLPAENKKTGQVRILVVGDSVAYGCCGLDEGDAWPARLKEHLDSWAPSGVEFVTFNGAVPGYNAQQCKRLIQSRLIEISPDVILWHENPEAHDQLELPEPAVGITLKARNLMLRSKLIHLALELKRNRGDDSLDSLWRTYNSPYFPMPKGSIVPLTEVARWCKMRGVDSFYGVEKLLFFRQDGAIEGSERDWNQANIEFVRLRDAFLAYSEGTETLFSDNCHFTKQGADLAAKQVSEFLRSRWGE
jgi:lysophospholipase L1-like esterase